MANKRELKKEIKYVCGDVAAECLIAKHFVKGADKKALDEIIGDVADLQISALSSATFAFDKQPHDFDTPEAYHKSRRAYYAKAYASLRTKFYDRINALVKRMNAAIPQEVRDAVKKG